MLRQCYISQRTCQKVLHKIFHKTLYGDPAHPEDFDSFRFQTKFLFHYCRDHPSFWRLHHLVKEHPIFMSPQHSWQVQAPSEFQLLVLLKYVGLQGIDASNTSLASHFQISIGTTEKYRKWAAQAVLSLEADLYHWPDHLEHRTMSFAIQKKWFSPNCVGFMDGTLLPFEFKPKLHGETYYSWKGFFQSTC